MASIVRRGAVAVVLGAALAAANAPAIAEAQETRPFTPSNEELDRQLDETLEREYLEADRTPPPPPPPPSQRREKRDDELKLRLGVMGAYFAAFLDDVEISHRDGASGGLKVRLADEFDFDDLVDDPDGRYDWGEQTDSGTFRAWLDLGKHVGFVGGFRRASFDDSMRIGAEGAPSAFTYGQTTFGTNERVESRIEVTVGDLDLVVRPLNLSWVTLDLSLGARYAAWDTTLERVSGGADAREREKIEAVLPMVGFGLALRPLECFEIFGRARFGHFEYEREGYTYYSDGEAHTVEPKTREATSAEIDFGVSFMVEQTFGLTVGYRLDVIELYREVEARSESVEGTMHGAYFGAILQF